jgi:RluA family pseudouridine synthase
VIRLTRALPASEDGTRLEDAVRAWLTAKTGRPIGRADARRLVMAGAIRVDGRPTRRPGLTLRSGTRLFAQVDLDRLKPREANVVFSARDVLLEDRWLLAVRKPPGLPTHVTADSSRDHLVGAVSRWLADRDEARAGPIRLGVHQRLDRDTSGIVLFTKEREADRGLAAQFAAREVGKTYHALCLRPARLPPPQWTTKGRLPGTSETGDAVSDFRCLETHRLGLLVEARPSTGRKHQIRIQLAAAGLSILGDDRYGAATGSRKRAPRLMLHASRLELRHPVTGDPLTLECSWPEDFASCLRSLRQDAWHS